MNNDYNNPTDQMKAISWQLKRIADSLEQIQDNMNPPKLPKSMSETYEFQPTVEHTEQLSGLRDFLYNLHKD